MQKRNRWRRAVTAAIGLASIALVGFAGTASAAPDDILITPPDLFFEATAVGSTSMSQDQVFQNNTAADIALLPQVGAEWTNEFGVAETTCGFDEVTFEWIIPASSSCIVTWLFAPIDAGPEFQQVSWMNQSTGDVFATSYSGEGTGSAEICDNGVDDDGDGEIDELDCVPPAEVPEAPFAVLLPLSTGVALAGGLLIRRRMRLSAAAA